MLTSSETLVCQTAGEFNRLRAGAANDFNVNSCFLSQPWHSTTTDLVLVLSVIVLFYLFTNNKNSLYFYSSCFTPSSCSLSTFYLGSSIWFFSHAHLVQYPVAVDRMLICQSYSMPELTTLATVLSVFQSAVCGVNCIDWNWLMVKLTVCISHSLIFQRAPSWGRT